MDIPSTINVNLALADTVRATYNVTRYALSWLASSFIGHDVDRVDVPPNQLTHNSQAARPARSTSRSPIRFRWRRLVELTMQPTPPRGRPTVKPRHFHTAPCWHSDRLRSSFFVLRSLFFFSLRFRCCTVKALPDGAPRPLLPDQTVSLESYPSLSSKGDKLVHVLWDDTTLSTIQIVSVDLSTGSVSKVHPPHSYTSCSRGLMADNPERRRRTLRCRWAATASPGCRR